MASNNIEGQHSNILKETRLPLKKVNIFTVYHIKHLSHGDHSFSGEEQRSIPRRINAITSQARQRYYHACQRLRGHVPKRAR